MSRYYVKYYNKKCSYNLFKNEHIQKTNVLTVNAFPPMFFRFIVDQFTLILKMMKY